MAMIACTELARPSKQGASSPTGRWPIITGQRPGRLAYSGHMTYTGDGWAIGTDGSRRWGTLGAAGLFLHTYAAARPEEQLVLMQHRASWTNRGDTWALPGGAVDVGETPEQGALRETWEETGINPDDVEIEDSLVTTSIELDRVLRRQPILEEDEYLLDPIKAMIERDGDVAGALREHPVTHPEHHGKAVFGLNAQFWWEVPDSSVNEWRYTTVIGRAKYPLELAPTEESTDLKWWPLDKLEELPLMPEFRANVDELRAQVKATTADEATPTGNADAADETNESN